MRKFGCFLLCLFLLAIPAQAAEEPITRGDFLLLLWSDAGGVPYDITAHPFTDLEGRDDLKQAAGWAYDLGLIKGVGDNQFAPCRPLTREECAVLLRRYDTYLGRDTWLPDLAACNDYEDAFPWSADDLYWACATGRMGWKNGRLAPLDPVTMAEGRKYFTNNKFPA